MVKLVYFVAIASLFSIAFGGNANADFDREVRDIPCLVRDACGVCNGDNTTCMCLSYLGYDLFEVDYALLRYTVLSSLIKINDTLDVLYTIKEALECYDYETGQLSLADYIDVLHGFCDECLDHFDYTQMWFADHIAGNCEDTDCEPLTFGNYERKWTPLQLDL